VTTVHACFLVFFIATAFVSIWFSTARAELVVRRRNLEDLERQLRLHEALRAQTEGSPDALAAAGMLKTSHMLWREAAKGYNHLLRKPLNRLPALLMGYQPVPESPVPREEKSA
jgi:hypothetical protein